MSTPSLPPLALASWQPTRDTLQGYVTILGRLRAGLTPPQPHWQHISVRVGTGGLTTTPLSLPDGGRLEMRLDLEQHSLIVDSRTSWQLALAGQPPQTLGETVIAKLAEEGWMPPIDAGTLSPDGAWDRQAIAAYWQALTFTHAVLAEFRAGLPGSTTPIQLWPHHFDLAVNWFSGRKVPGYDPEDLEWADEQMGFGFSTGDGGIPDPYYYVTAYPWPEAIVESPLPALAHWHREGWNGAVLRYDALLAASDPSRLLLSFLRRAQEAGAACMI